MPPESQPYRGISIAQILTIKCLMNAGYILNRMHHSPVTRDLYFQSQSGAEYRIGYTGIIEQEVTRWEWAGDKTNIAGVK